MRKQHVILSVGHMDGVKGDILYCQQLIGGFFGRSRGFVQSQAIHKELVVPFPVLLIEFDHRLVHIRMRETHLVMQQGQRFKMDVQFIDVTKGILVKVLQIDIMDGDTCRKMVVHFAHMRIGTQGFGKLFRGPLNGGCLHTVTHQHRGEHNHHQQ